MSANITETVAFYEKQIAIFHELTDTLKTCIYEMVDELDWRGRTDHRELAIKSLRAAGVSDADIRGYFAGNIIL